MEENNKKGSVFIVYDSRFKPIPESSPLKKELTNLETRLEHDFGVKGELKCSNSLKLRGTMPNLRKAIEDIFKSSGLPFKAKRPSLDPRAIIDEQYSGEKEKEERGYALFKEMIEERGGRLSYLGPEEVSGEFSYILDS